MFDTNSGNATSLNRRRFLRATAATAATACLGTGAFAQGARGPIRIIVPYGAGGGIDMLGRLLAEVLRNELDVPTLVENRAGAGGMIGMRHVATSKADGNTIGLAGPGPLILSKLTRKEMPFNPDDLDIVTPLGGFGFVVVVRPDAPYKTLTDLVERSKSTQMNFGSAQVGSSTQMTLDYLMSESGLKGQSVPFAGDAEILTNLMGSSVDMGLVTMGGAVTLLEAGRVKALATTGESRSSRLPQVPTAKESGYQGFAAEAWTSLMVPKGTPTSIQREYNEIVSRKFATPEIRERLRQNGVDFTPMGLAAIKEFRAKEKAKWTQVAARAGIEPQ